MSEPGRQSVETTNRRPTALMGTFARSLDPKKRLTIPSVWRAALGPDLVYVVPDPRRRCLQLVPRDVMEAKLAKYQELALGDAEVNDALLDFANLKGSVVLKGGFRMATIWPEEAVAEGTEERMAKLGAAMAKLKF